MNISRYDMYIISRIRIDQFLLSNFNHLLLRRALDNRLNFENCSPIISKCSFSVHFYLSNSVYYLCIIFIFLLLFSPVESLFQILHFCLFSFFLYLISIFYSSLLLYFFCSKGFPNPFIIMIIIIQVYKDLSHFTSTFLFQKLFNFLHK